MDTESQNTLADESQYKFELYKSLRSEAAAYVTKVSSLWLQKFTLVGGLIAFLIVQHGQIFAVSRGDLIFVSAIVTIPILASLLDAKILEYTLHARAISWFLSEKYPVPGVIKEWEQVLWGDESTASTLTFLKMGGLRPHDLTKLRSVTTVLVTMIPTAGLILLSGIILSELSQNGYIVGLAVALAILYMMAGLVLWRSIWPHH